MNPWNKISLYKFQQIEAINNKPGVSDIDKSLFSTCIVFDYTEFELDNLKLEKVAKLTERLTRIFSTPFNPVLFKRVGKYLINYDVSKITLGQYIELSFFLSIGLQNAHYTMASISNIPFKKNKSSDHRKKSEYFLKQPITKVMGGISLIIKNFMAFNNEYKGLFGLDKEVNGDVQTNPFNKRYGWIYSASQVADYERITLTQAFKLPIRQAFNDLAYLKALDKYQVAQSKLK
jgi:hypothetical protein